MTLDFWNNPIVVSAFRVKYRRGGLSSSILLYVTLLAVGGAVMQYYNLLLGGNWQRKYYIALMGLQFGLSIFMASISTAASLRAEVISRTLDFQRIAALSPQQILLGKLLGEPALAYLLAVASIPLAVWACLLGGVTPDVLVLVYVYLATTIFMAGSFGLANRLEPPPGKPATAYASGEGAAVGIMLSVGLAVPLFYGLLTNNILKPDVPFFGYHVPTVFIIPVVQLALAILPFHIMVRLLVHPQNPMVSRPVAYLTLALIDFLAAAVLADPRMWGMIRGWTFGTRTAAFCVAHLVASGILMTLMTPRGEIVETWVWRFRGQGSWLRTWLLGDRAPTTGALLVFCVQGVLGWLLFLWLPAHLMEDPTQVAPGLPVAGAALLATVFLTLAFGVLYQLVMFLPTRRRSLVSNFISLIVFIPYLVGKAREVLPVDFILTISPIDQFKHWLNPGLEPLPLPPLLLLYGFLFLAGFLALQARLGRLQAEVRQKLQAMGVVAP